MSHAPFYSLPGKMKKLLDRLSVARADNLDEITPTRLARLDAAVTSRADAASYTPARALLIDKLDATILSRASATDYDAARAAKLDDIRASHIKSINHYNHYGNTGTSNDSIASVDLTKTMFVVTGAMGAFSGNSFIYPDTSTNVKVVHNGLGTVYYSVIEFY